MNLLVLTPFFSCEGYEKDWKVNFDPHGGMQLFVSRVCQNMEKIDKNLHITVLTMGHPQIPKTRLYSKRIRVVARRYPIPLIKSSLGGYCGLVKSWGVAAIVWMIKNRKKKIDAVYCHGDGSGTAMFAALMAKKLFEVPTVLQIHSSRGATQVPTTFFEKVTQKAAVKYEKLAVENADAVYVLSEQTKNYFLQNLSKKVTIKKEIFLLNDTMQSDVKEGIKKKLKDKYHIPNRHLILYVGRISSEKGCERLVTLAERLDLTKYHILICGDGPTRNELENTINRKQLSYAFTLTGFLPYKMIPSVMDMCDVGIVPSVYEELGLVILEMMNMGLPVVTHDLSTIRQLVRHNVNGCLVKPDDYNSMVQCIDRLIHDTDFRTGMIQEAHKQMCELHTCRAYSKHILQDLKIW